MRIMVDFDRCDSNGLCVETAPELFELDQRDVLQVRTERPEPELWPVAEEAARVCPKLAISLMDEH